MSNFYYVTTYALTNGVLVIPKDKAQLVNSDSSRPWLKWGKYFGSAHGKNFHVTKEAAELRVVEMKAVKRKSIEKQLARLSKPVKFIDYEEKP